MHIRRTCTPSVDHVLLQSFHMLRCYIIVCVWGAWASSSNGSFSPALAKTKTLARLQKDIHRVGVMYNSRKDYVLHNQTCEIIPEPCAATCTVIVFSSNLRTRAGSGAHIFIHRHMHNLLSIFSFGIESPVDVDGMVRESLHHEACPISATWSWSRSTHLQAIWKP